MRTCADLIIDLQQQILTVYDDVVLARQYAWWTLETITGLRKAALIAGDSLVLTDEQQQRLHAWLVQLVDNKMPIAYLMGTVPFGQVTIAVEPPVLIPRPETEEWCMALIERLKPFADQPLKILDLCCGSGCIAIAIAHALPRATVYAVDIAEHALALTRKNVQSNAVQNVIVVQSDLFEQISREQKFDCIVTNPPYIAPAEWATLDPSVTQWEDKQALVAAHDGLAIINRIITQAPNYIRPNQLLAAAHVPQLMIEIGYRQGPVVAALMRQAFYTDVAIYQDLEKKDRIVVGRVDHVGSAR